MVITTINHSYCSYKPTERYQTGASHCTFGQALILNIEYIYRLMENARITTKTDKMAKISIFQYGYGSMA